MRSIDNILVVVYSFLRNQTLRNYRFLMILWKSPNMFIVDFLHPHNIYTNERHFNYVVLLVVQSETCAT